MAITEGLKRQGRIVYVEPNNLKQTEISNAIPFDYEDYCISVNLRIYKGDRYACGFPDDSNTDVKTYSSDNGTLGFLGGTDGYLTTNFTDINLNDPKTNTKECLGIESINIEYKSWFYPSVDIKFVDVRGASLFSPTEQEYVNAEGYERNLSSKSFMNSFFSFPYPMFKLSVKGFYGKEVTYDLALKDTKMSFNSNTGNFEITAQFIGYMYGVYTDIPMSLLSIAPYIDYYSKGKEYWEHEKENKNFYFSDGTQLTAPMTTFPELIELASDIGEKAKSALKDSTEGKRLKNVASELKSLEEIKSVYRTFTSNWYYFKNCDETNNLYGIYCPLIRNVGKDEDAKTIEQNTIENITKLVLDIDSYNELVTKNEEVGRTLSILKKETIFNDIKKEYEEKVKGKNGEEKEKGYEEISNKYLTYFTLVVNDSTLETNEEKKNCDTSDNFYSTLKEHILNGDEDKAGIKKTLIDSDTNKYCKVFFFEFNERDPMEEVDKYINSLEEEQKSLNEKLKKLKNETMVEGLGFNPTIKNIFNMTFAHIDTFVSTYYECLRKIKEEIDKGDGSGRLIKDFVTGGIQTDMGKSSKSQSLPPFVDYYREKTLDTGGGNDKAYERLWPGELENGNELEETKLVYAIAKATTLYSNEIKRVISDDEMVDVTGNFHPVTLYDFKNTHINPYSEIVISNMNKEEILEKLLFAFWLRCYYYYFINGNVDLDACKTFGMIEADNVLKAIKNSGIKVSSLLSDKLINSKNSPDATSETYLKEMAMEKWPTILGKKYEGPLFSNADGKIDYGWLYKDNMADRILPIGEYNATDINEVMLSEVYANNSKYLKIDKIENNGSSFNIIGDRGILTALKEKVYNENGVGDTIKTAYKYFEENMGSLNKDISDIRYNENIWSGNEEKTGYTFGYLFDNDVRDHNIVLPSVSGLYSKNKITDGGSIFGHPIYYAQSNMLSKAYLFLMGIPVRSGELFWKETKSATVPEVFLLREGAYYWGEEFKKTGYYPINCNNMWKNPESGETFCVLNENGYLSFYPIPLNSSLEYAKINTGTIVTDSRRKELIKNFEEWATNGDFKIIDSSLSLKGFSDATYVLLLDKTYLKNNLYSNLGDSTTREKCRPNLTLYSAATESNKTEYNKLQEILRKLLYNFVTYVDYAVKNADEEKVNYSSVKASTREFLKVLADKISVDTKEKSDEKKEELTGNNYDIYGSDDLYRGIYDLLRTLYNKWFCSNKQNLWKFSANGMPDICEFSRFVFMDSYYHKIGDRLIVGLTKTNNILKNYTFESVKQLSAEPKLEKSVYEYLNEVANKNGMLFLALPVMYGLAGKEDDIVTMFSPVPYNSSKISSSPETTYLVMYSYQPSAHLDLGNNAEYDNDGTDLADSKGNIKPKLPSYFSDGDEESYNVPAFGVTFAKQNQSFFKNLQLNSTSPQVTEASIKAMMSIASKGNEGPRGTEIYGQDFYRLYSNYSYQCGVETMGNAQIMPLVYFQLNNIPMFKGAYMIIGVKHSITSNNSMTTNFTGVRISKKTVPFVKADFIYIDDEYQNNEITEEPTSATTYATNNAQDESPALNSGGENKVSMDKLKKLNERRFSEFATGKYSKGRFVDGLNNNTEGNLFDFSWSSNWPDENYLAKKGWNGNALSSVLSVYDSNLYSSGKKTTLKYLMIHITDGSQTETPENVGTAHHYKDKWRRPPYNVVIDSAGTLSYLWPHPSETTNNGWNTAYKVNSAINYNPWTFAIAIIGRWKNGTMYMTEAQKKTLQQYVCAFIKYHPNVKVIGHHQVEPEKTCPCFYVPKFLDAMAENVNEYKERIKKAAIRTDSSFIMESQKNGTRYIGGDNKYWVYSTKTNQWVEYDSAEYKNIK